MHGTANRLNRHLLSYRRGVQVFLRVAVPGGLMSELRTHGQRIYQEHYASNEKSRRRARGRHVIPAKLPVGLRVRIADWPMALPGGLLRGTALLWWRC